MTTSKLEGIRERLYSESQQLPFRLVVVHRGRVVAEWNNRLGRRTRLSTASVAKSLHVSMLGIAVSEGVIASPDDPVIAYYPAMAEVAEGRGPKPGRHTTPDDAAITFRELAAHMSGYLKPDERPGEVFHYQTFGMNVLAHAIATAYGIYDAALPAGQQASGMGDLLRSKVRDRIGATWTWRYRNFEDLAPQAKVGVFGNSLHVQASALDLARIGWLWRCDGDWFGEAVIPAGWVESCRQIPALARTQLAESAWSYGQGFWVNHGGNLWAQLPERSFSAWGRGGHNIWVDPERDLVVATGPLPLEHPDREGPETIGDGVVPRIVDALERP